MAKIYKRGKVWYSRIRINGDEIRKPLSTDRRIAEERLGELIKNRNAARHGHAPTNASWPTFRDELLRASKLNKNIRTWQAEARAFREMEAIVTVQRINQITPHFLEEIIKPAWIAAGRGKYVINRDLRSIRSAMRKAEAYGYVARQDWTVNKYIKTPKGRLCFWTLAELLQLREHCHGLWKTLLYLGSRAGLRRAEIRELPWKEVDFERNRIHIAPSDTWIPKDHERRFIPMAPDLREYLLSIKNGDSYVFSEAGERPTIGTMTTYFGRLVRKANLRGSIHTLRHCFGAHLASNGVPLKFIKEWMGHSKISTTEIYSHLIPGSFTDHAINQLPQLPE
jgi:integrase